jgi:hypothetical protein
MHRMRLHAAPHISDGPLRRHTEHLRERERCRGAHERGSGDRKRQRPQHLELALPDDIVDQVLGAGGQHQPGHLADEHQRQTKGEPPAVQPHEVARFTPGRRPPDGILLLVVALRGQGSGPPRRCTF